jgi:hypothetical protein
VIGAPPLDAGAVHETVANAFPATAETEVGAPGAVADALVRNSSIPATYAPDGDNPDVVIDGAVDPADRK